MAISVGAKRTLKFTNTIGSIQEQNIELNHGSLHTMSRESQSVWLHSIVKDPSVIEPRVSFTFRRLKPHVSADKPVIPAIAPPKPPKLPKSIETGRGHNRILLLTDSIIASTPEFLFDSEENHKCIKNINYELVNVFNFEPEFGYTNYVIISGGVNDLSRHGLNAHTLADMVCKRLQNTCKKYKNTVFIFNSLLLTKLDWVNTEILEFNRIMFELSIDIPNLYFFDSHDILMNGKLKSVIEENRNDRRGNGIHITLEAKKLVTRQLVNGVAYLQVVRIGGRVMDSLRLRSWYWPLRNSFLRKLQESAPG